MEGKHSSPERSGLIRTLILLLAAVILLTAGGIAAAGRIRSLRAQEAARKAAEEAEAERIRAEEEQAERERLASAMEASARETYDALVPAFVREPEEGCLYVEYAKAQLPARDLLSSCPGSLTVDGPDPLDLSRTGDVEITFSLTAQDAYGQTVTRDFPLTVRIGDSAPPEIVLTAETAEAEFRSEFDPLSVVLSVEDPADGPLAAADVPAPGSYTVTSNVDTQVPGDYEVRILATDANGNTAESLCAVRVLPKRTMDRPELRGIRYGDAQLPYVVMVNRAANTVTVCTKDDEGDTVPVRAMVCSTGPATPKAGSVYPIAGRWRWLALFGPCYGQYATQITGNILFHSVPYFTQDMGDLEYEEYNKLGTSCSMGCIRLSVEDALWIYENMPRGTRVVFYDDADDPGPLGKPVPLTIDPESPNRGWDPTDPDPGNPWHTDGPG